MSKKTADRLERLERRVETLTREVGRLAAGLEGGASEGPDCTEVVAYLDQFRAGEALGEASLGEWIAVCRTACLRGGLRTIQHREGFHARLLEERMKELGATPAFALPDALVDAVMKGSADPDVPDLQKLQAFVARFPDPDEALRPIHEMADKLDADPETQSLLRTIAQDERSTLEFLRDACGQLTAAENA